MTGEPGPAHDPRESTGAAPVTAVDPEAERIVVAEAASEQEPDDDVVVLPWWQNPRNIITIVVTIALLGGMVGWLIGHESNSVDASDVDVGFLQDMRAHHEQAVEMSLTYLGLDDIDPQLVPVARSIAFGQGLEIGLMLQLLRDMDAQTEGDPDQAMAWMGMPMAEADMPGMASDEQLSELAGSSGTDADQLFIDLMVAHHEGGLEMLEHAAEHASNDDVRTYASAWDAAQRDEINELHALAAPAS